MFELSLVLGVLMLVIALAILLDTKRIQKLFKGMLENPSCVFFMGLFNVLFGLFMLMQNHVLSVDFEGLFALLGWLITLRGILLAWFTDEMIKVAKKKLKNTSFLMFAGFVHLVLGGALLYFVYMML